MSGFVSADFSQPTTVSQTSTSPVTSTTRGSGDTCSEPGWYVGAATFGLTTALTDSRENPAGVLLLLLDHQERAHRSRQRVQAQADPESSPETRARMSGPGHFPQGAGDGGGRRTLCRLMQAPPRTVSDANCCLAPKQRLHQIEIKRKLEEFTRKDRVHRIKVHHHVLLPRFY